MTDETPYLVTRSIEPTRATYLVRRVLVVATAAVVTVGGLMAAGVVDPPPNPLIGSDAPPPAPSGEAATEAEPNLASQATPPTTTTSPASDPVDDTDGSEEALPERTSRLVGQAPTRVLDTRQAGDPPLPEATHSIAIEGEATAVAIAVSVMRAERAGTVLIDGRAGVVEAVAAGTPGVTTTNLVVVPIVGDELTVRSSAGGHLVVDVVGRFEPSGATASGRFVAGEPTEIAQLETETDGRETELPFGRAVSAGQADAFLVVITADVGADGGMVRIGPEADRFDQMLMWGPALDDNRLRRGIALIRPDVDGTGHLRYEGGSHLTAEVIGYFTNDEQAVATEGLYVPTGPRRLFDGVLEPDRPAVVVRGIEPQADAALVTVASGSTGPGRLGSFLLPVTDGGIDLTANTELEATVTLLGVFI